MWAHEFSFRTWREDPTPDRRRGPGYLEADYDFPDEIAAVAKDLEAAKAEVHGRGAPRDATGIVCSRLWT